MSEFRFKKTTTFLNIDKPQMKLHRLYLIHNRLLTKRLNNNMLIFPSNFKSDLKTLFTNSQNFPSWTLKISCSLHDQKKVASG